MKNDRLGGDDHKVFSVLSLYACQTWQQYLQDASDNSLRTLPGDFKNKTIFFKNISGSLVGEVEVVPYGAGSREASEIGGTYEMKNGISNTFYLTTGINRISWGRARERSRLGLWFRMFSQPPSLPITPLPTCYWGRLVTAAFSLTPLCDSKQVAFLYLWFSTRNWLASPTGGYVPGSHEDTFGCYKEEDACCLVGRGIRTC